MIALVRSPIAASAASAASQGRSSPEMSANTGMAPAWRIAPAVATKVREGTITSSPGTSPAAAQIRWRAAVQLVTATA